jgi:hypothetical protein
MLETIGVEGLLISEIVSKPPSPEIISTPVPRATFFKLSDFLLLLMFLTSENGI